MRPRRATRGAALSFAASTAGSIGLAVVYSRGGQPQLEGVCLGVALGGMCAGLVLWAKRLMPPGPATQARAVTPPQAAQRGRAEQAFEQGAHRIGRRRFLGRMLTLAAAAFGLAAVAPLRSLGGRPGGQLRHTAWRRGVRAVTQDGRPVRAGDLAVDGVLTVFPEGSVGSADSQTLLIRLAPGGYRPLPGRETWAPGDVVAFSKICTHAGCPVGLYRADAAELYCPCHQSVFEVLQAARPSEGPATRPLPQLPLAQDAAGFVVAQSDFTEPVGPGFWDRDRHG